MNKRIKSTYLIKLKTLITFFCHHLPHLLICHICAEQNKCHLPWQHRSCGTCNQRQRLELFFSTLHYNIKHYITLHYNIKHYISLHYITLCLTIHYVTLRYITSNYATFCHIMLHYIMLNYITPNYVTLSYITLHYITLHYIDQAERVIIVRGWTSFCLKITLLPDVDFQQQTLLPVV